MNKLQIIKLLEGEGWTKADAMRALEAIDFSCDPDEITIRRTISSFAGSELIKRQRLQAAQKSLVTKKTKEIELKEQELNKFQKQEKEKYEVEIQKLFERNKILEAQFQNINFQNSELIQANDQLKKDNKSLKNIIDAIKLKLALDTKRLLQYEDSEIRKALINMFKSTLG
ncbi:hypothetical protein I8751_26665 [Nostocaceae cyanobacterium CENA357]|uniref:Uncharacterized protein n=1 Tax=Atlanticothrix silvestris CENA357 TaxID=1725252 RepID=A0A8J7HHW9_9CYAN|nr:hypothetical protein [Atlanticothrix silvestris]MBH8555863.1 hypothetical protein [Atlanticothrix silvestris CENA357]